MKFTVFRELLDYMAHISTVTDADMNFIDRCIRIVGENEKATITIEVTITDKEEKENA